MDEFFKELGYMQNDADPCTYHKWVIKDNQKCILFIAVYVNDLLIASNNTDTLLLEKKRLGEHFKMEDKREVHYILRMSVMWNRKEKLLTIDQHTFLSSVLERFGMENCKPVATVL